MAKEGGEWNDGKWSEKKWREVKMATISSMRETGDIQEKGVS